MEEHEKKRIIKNLKWLTFSKIIIYLLSIITITVVPRYLGVEGYGELNFIISFVGIFSILGDLGLQTLITRDISKDPKKFNEYFSNLFLFRLLITFGFIILVFLFSFLQKSAPISYVLTYTFGVGSLLLVSFNLSFLNAIQKNKYQAITDAIQKLVYTLGIVLVIYFNFKLFGILVASALSGIFAFIFSFISIKKYLKSKSLKFNKNYIKEKLILSSPFIFTSIFWTIYLSIDKIFITFIKGNYQTGLYSISYSFIGFLLGFLGIVNLAFFPILSNASNNKEKLKSTVDKYLLLLYLFCVPVTFGGIYLAPQIISLVFGSQYLGGTTAFQLTMLFFMIHSVGVINYNLLITNNLEKYSLKILGISALANILLNFIFVPWLGIIGAAITTIFSEILVFYLSYKKIKEKIISINYFSKLLKPLISSLFMLLGLLIYSKTYPGGILQNNFEVLISISIAVVIYLLFLFITNAITLKQAKEMIKNE